MESLATDLGQWLKELTGWNGSWMDDVAAVVIIVVFTLVVVLVTLMFGGLMTWLERRVSGRAQSRVGPTGSVPSASCNGWRTG